MPPWLSPRHRDQVRNLTKRCGSVDHWSTTSRRPPAGHSGGNPRRHAVACNSVAVGTRQGGARQFSSCQGRQGLWRWVMRPLPLSPDEGRVGFRGNTRTTASRLPILTEIRMTEVPIHAARLLKHCQAHINPEGPLVTTRGLRALDRRATETWHRRLPASP